MKEVYKISVNSDLLKGEFRLPYSKSESNRALIIKALNGNKMIIHNLSEADDTLHLNKCLRFINTCGVSGIPMVVDVKNVGTAMRFLTAFLSIRHGKWMLGGSERMKDRPILYLVSALKSLGAKISYLEKSGFPPLLIEGEDIHGGSVSIDAGMSSQFITALLLIAPSLPRGLKIDIKGEFVSKPYVMMTIQMLKSFGVDISYTDAQILVSNHKIEAESYEVSPDWSAASYAYELVALSAAAELFIPKLKKKSLQGDNVLPEIYGQLGVKSTFSDDGLWISKMNNKLDYFEYDFVDCPDLAQTVISTCVGLGIEGRFYGLQSLKIKETDRIEKMNDTFSVFGFNLEESEKGWLLKKIKEVNYTSINHSFRTFGDHRIAMSVLPLALKTKKLVIEDPSVVDKSFPHFWEEIENLGIEIRKD